MKVEIKKIEPKDLVIVAKLLTQNFAKDKGVIVLFKKEDPKYIDKVNQWFISTLKMMINGKQNINIAFVENKIVGVSIVTHSSFNPSIISLLKWTYSVLITCGLTTVIESAKHDKNRKKSFTKRHQYILEFIAVDESYSGNGIGKQLSADLHELAKTKNTTVWLETTKANNIKIFNKMNYHLVKTKLELGVKYYIMTNESTEELKPI